MAKQWYVIHTYSGYENKAKLSLEQRIKELGKDELFGEVLVPSEKVVEVVKGAKRESTRKFFPSYMLVEMEMNDETWYVVKNTPKVTGFIGGQTNPTPITEAEVKQILGQMEEGLVNPRPKYEFSVNEAVKVIDGPFSNFSGIVEDVNPDKGKLRVLVSIFGRSTPVELEFFQVEKA
jgi:transcriptional antiterminator NusG